MKSDHTIEELKEMKLKSRFEQQRGREMSELALIRDKILEIASAEKDKLGDMLLKHAGNSIEANWQGGKVNGLFRAFEAINEMYREGKR